MFDIDLQSTVILQKDQIHGFQRHVFCYRGEGCRFFHPPGRNKPSSQPDPSLKPDCVHWLAGHCRYREEICRGKHDANKCGNQSRSNFKSMQSNQQDFNNPDFVQTRAKAVSQNLAGGQTQVVNQPQQQIMNQNIPQQPMIMNHPQLQTMQQLMIKPMMLPPGQNMGFPNPHHGGQGSRL